MIQCLEITSSLGARRIHYQDSLAIEKAANVSKLLPRWVRGGSDKEVTCLTSTEEESRNYFLAGCEEDSHFLAICETKV